MAYAKQRLRRSTRRTIWLNGASALCSRALRHNHLSGATLKDALEHLLGQALAHEFPAHPEFEREVRPADLRIVFEVARQAAGDGRRSGPGGR